MAPSIPAWLPRLCLMQTPSSMSMDSTNSGVPTTGPRPVLVSLFTSKVSCVGAVVLKKQGLNVSHLLLLLLWSGEKESKEEEEELDSEAENVDPQVCTPVVSSGVAVKQSEPPAKKARTLKSVVDGKVDPFLQWTPVSVQSQFEDYNLRSWVTVGILLPSGVNDPKDMKVRLSDSLDQLVLSVKWPDFMGDVDQLEAALDDHLDDEKSGEKVLHPRTHGFHKFFSMLRGQEGDELYSSGFIPLPFTCDKASLSITPISKKSLGLKVVFVDVRALDTSDYKHESAGTKFIEID